MGKHTRRRHEIGGDIPPGTTGDTLLRAKENLRPAHERRLAARAADPSAPSENIQSVRDKLRPVGDAPAAAPLGAAPAARSSSTGARRRRTRRSFKGHRRTRRRFKGRGRK